MTNWNFQDESAGCGSSSSGGNDKNLMLEKHQESSVTIVLLCNSFNSMSQRIYLECKQLGYSVNVHEFEDVHGVIEKVDSMKPDIILCPFLTKRVPAEIYENKKVPCLIFHPGIEGDRGMSSIDWALLERQSVWGLTIMQAHEEMDSGDIWATKEFSTHRTTGGPPSKSSLYRIECIEAAVKGLRDALDKFNRNISPKPLDYSDPRVRGTLKPKMKNGDRKVDWNLGMSDIVRIVRASDSQPGVLEVFSGIKYFMYGCHEEAHFTYDVSIPPKTILAQRHGAILLSCGQHECVWISHLKKLNTQDQKYFKLPACMVLPPAMLQDVPSIAEPSHVFGYGTYPKTFQEIFTWSESNICYIVFDFYNGAMSTAQCKRLCAAWDRILSEDASKVIVLMGGVNFFSNGIHLNMIESSTDPALESWDNINAIDDFVQRILLVKDRYVISAMQGNSGAGGVMAALAADQVWAHENVVPNPSYKAMNLYGSEYWTYSLPRRVGNETAEKLVGSTEPLGALEAEKIGLIDKVLCSSAVDFLSCVQKEAREVAGSADLSSSIESKNSKDMVHYRDEIESCRSQELKEMKKCFGNENYHRARKAFVYKSKILPCVVSSVKGEETSINGLDRAVPASQ